jgi:hypothetical protein
MLDRFSTVGGGKDNKATGVCVALYFVLSAPDILVHVVQVSIVLNGIYLVGVAVSVATNHQHI